jgi:U3 small nucleolar RNA-associated protein 14
VRERPRPDSEVGEAAEVEGEGVAEEGGRAHGPAVEDHVDGPLGVRLEPEVRAAASLTTKLGRTKNSEKMAPASVMRYAVPAILAARRRDRAAW